ncbi:porin [Shewanella sp. VB17]|uniref:oligogalacturonate-specific porin KdgM family protein n=1 Tax=Shewanella sp. VB17 TaxID=2739432 RepID=UPI001565DBFF|nr:oligogalacturonate-specific porin KdgM family protein [Shewanella sp. VB17]NRD73130.1 porin [Shewanella sp. VB17]
MKKIIKKTTFACTIPAIFISGSVIADSSYVTGNVQFHDGDIHGSEITSTLEAGHTFDNSLGGLTLLTEFDDIQLGELTGETNSAPYVTLGMEQSINVNSHFWVAVGYHHLVANGDTVQYRPLVKVGYNFDNGWSISNRTRVHIDATSVENDADVRMDNRISYAVADTQLTLSYNNVYLIAGDTKDGSSRDNTMDHELRATWTRKGVQPYFEFRNQADNQNNALVFGASYGF